MNSSSKQTDHFVIQLPVKEGESILQCFHSESSIEVMSGDCSYYCNHCATNVLAHKRSLYTYAPPVLVISIKCWDKNGNKIPVSSEKELFFDFTPFMTQTDTKAMYYLSGVVIHSGSVTNGHYVSFVKSPSGPWWISDGQRTSIITEDQVHFNFSSLSDFSYCCKGTEI